MGLLSSSSRLSSSNLARSRAIGPSCFPLLAFLIISIFLLYKVDIYIPHSRRGARQFQATSVDNSPVSYSVEPRQHLDTLWIPDQKNGTFDRLFEITWGKDHANIFEDGELLTLSLDKRSGSGFRSKDEYLFGKIDMQLKLVEGNSAGTVTAYYLSSEGDFHDEIDFEFLGNSSGDPYTLHTNVYSQGKGDREQQFFLWFDPTTDFHTYTVIWNPQRILFYVDDIPIREFKNNEAIGVPFPNTQPMRIHSSIWNAEEWATRGGLVKTNWSRAPFIASYKNFSADACIWSSSRGSSCLSNSTTRPWFREKLNTAATRRLKWAQKYHRVYNYCIDKWRFPKGLAPECRLI